MAETPMRLPFSESSSAVAPETAARLQAAANPKASALTRPFIDLVIVISSLVDRSGPSRRICETVARRSALAGGSGGGHLVAQAVARHALDDVLDLLLGQDRRLADLQGAVILARQRLDLDGQPHRLGEARSDRDHAVLCEQACLAVAQRLQRVRGKLRRAEGGVGRAAYVAAAGDRD